MKISNAGYIAKAVALILTGTALAFFPGIFNSIFLLLGIIIIASCGLMLLPSMLSGDGSGLFGSSITGIVIGVIVIFLPRLIVIGLAIFGGIGFVIWGAVQIGKAMKADKSSDKRLFGLIFGVVLIVLGGFLMLNPFKGATVARMVIGLTLVLLGLYNIYIAQAINERNKMNGGGIIDIDSFSVRDDDDDKFLP